MKQITDALTHFRRVDPTLYKACVKIKPILISRMSEIEKKSKTNVQLFSSLCQTIVCQQLATKAADSIWSRVLQVCGGKVTVDSITRISLPRLRSAGLSNAKAKTMKELAKEIKKGLKLTSLASLSVEEAIEKLTQIWGIGPWTCEMFLMFGLNHPDIFSARDLGLKRSMESIYKLKKDSALHKLEKIASTWSPHRTVACRVLWLTRDQPSS